MEDTAPFILIRYDGSTLIFNDLRDLAISASSARIKISRFHSPRSDWQIPSFKYSISDYCSGDWVVRDDAGKEIPPSVVWSKLPRKEYIFSKTYGKAIPGTGKRSRGHYFRHPHSLNVNRARESATVDERDKEFRSIRINKIKKLPNSWDDIIVSALYNRNWKKFRKTRWKKT